MSGSALMYNFDQVKKYITERPVALEYIIAAVVLLVTIVIFALWRRRRTLRRDVLLVGLCDSGKTLLFTQLVHNKFVETYTSIKENIGAYVANNKYVRIVDIPGHERLRAKFLDEYKPLTMGIIFVVDSVAIQKDVQDVAEYLYTLLSDPVIAGNHPPVLIVCNKQDQTLAKGIPVVKALLEKEMNVLRVTKSSQLESTNETGNKNSFLGKQGKDFEFAHLSPIKVDFVEASAAKGTDSAEHISGVREWLAKIA